MSDQPRSYVLTEPQDNHAAFFKIANHQHHEIEVVLYGASVDDPRNAAVECRDCNEVIADADRWIELPPSVVGTVVTEVEFCDCTNEELEAGRVCDQPQCPNRETAP
jgi:hypothetical protein